MYTVYMHKNKIDNRIYIGITCRNPEKRWQKGNGYRGNNHFYNAINKYGWDNFDHIVIRTNLTKREAELLEISLIKEYDSTDPDKGYNIQYGGFSIGRHNEKTKKLISKIQEKPVYQYDRYTGLFIAEFKSTLEAEKKLGIPNSNISSVCLKKMKTANGFVFRYANEESLIYGAPLNKDELKKVNRNDCFVRVVQYLKTGEFVKIYDNIKIASSETNTSTTSISGCLSGKNKTANGYIWMRLDKDSVDIPLHLSEKELEKHVTLDVKQVAQYDLNGKFIAKYDSISLASLATGCSSQSIGKVCIGKGRTAKGYVWRYYEDVKNNLYEIYVPKDKSKRRVGRFDLNENLLNVYESISIASDIMNVDVSSIWGCCVGKCKTIKGYIWKYI